MSLSRENANPLKINKYVEYEKLPRITNYALIPEQISKILPEEVFNNFLKAGGKIFLDLDINEVVVCLPLFTQSV